MSETPPPSRDEIFKEIVLILSDSFELEPASIKHDSTLYEDLDLDSIDAIDIFTQLREMTGRRPDPADARKVRTVDELITFVLEEIEKARAGVPEVTEEAGASAVATEPDASSDIAPANPKNDER